MSSSTKVFIYNGFGADPSSAYDLRELLSKEDLFATKPDVSFSDFRFSAKGLKRPLLVVPGGALSQVGSGIMKSFNAIREDLDHNFNYMGICAGAMLATHNAECVVSHVFDEDERKLSAPFYLYSTKARNGAFNLIDDFQANGSFYPTDSYLQVTRELKQWVPYCVTAKLLGNNARIPQLYISGPGFIADRALESCQSQVVAVYDDKPSYDIYRDKAVSRLTFFPAMIHRRQTENRPGVLLSGTHLEACVDGSRLLAHCQQAGPESEPLSNNDYAILKAEQPGARCAVESLIRSTFKSSF